MLFSCVVYLIQPLISGATSLKNALGYFLGSAAAFCLFVTYINSVFPWIQPKVIDDVILVGIGVLIKIICVVYNDFKAKQEKQQWRKDNVW